ncbi:MAG TPA: enoyl-CoA hydratase-related protein [Bacteriovoracaceae bacterium]|nr:enoyl-CoA hydratase-related protein [Bacteriovoracaceae bacterium]
MTNNYPTIVFTRTGDVGTLVINRPSKLNALNIQVHSELKSCLQELHRTDLKGLIFTGEGEKAFIAGADIAEMKPMSVSDAQAFSQLGQQVSVLLETLPYPVIAAVNGFALGGGFEMAMSCDFIFATKTAVFGLPEVKLGLIPGFGGTQRLTRIVGMRRAKEIMFSGRNVSSEEALKLGIVLDLFENKTDLLEAANKWLSLSMNNSTYAIGRAKSALQRGMETTLTDGLKLESQEFGSIFGSPDMLEGTAAFLEKRKAQFKGI